MKKRVLNYVIILITALSTSLSIANSRLPASDITTIEFENVQAGELLSMYTQSYELVYSESVTENGLFRKKYDMSLLPDGDYIIVLEKTEKLETQTFTIKNGITVDLSEKTIVYKPTANLIKNKLYVSQYTPQKSSLSIELYFNGVMIHDSTAQGTGSIGKIYQLDLAQKGVYKVILKSHGKVFKSTIEI